MSTHPSITVSPLLRCLTLHPLIAPVLAGVLALALISVPLYGSSTDAACGNGVPAGPSGPCDPCTSGEEFCNGVNIFNAYTGNASRTSSDIKVWSSVGGKPLAFERTHNTRITPNGTRHFGEGGNWRHSYQYTMADGATTTWTDPDTSTVHTLKVLIVTMPSGGQFRFVEGVGDPTTYYPPASVGRRISRSGDDFHVHDSDGVVHEFKKYTVNNKVSYRAERVVDTHGIPTVFTYNGSNELVTVTEAGGRSLSINYASQEVTRASDIHNIAGVAGATLAADGFYEVDVTWQRDRRLFRYYNPGNSGAAIAELQFIGEDGQPLVGTPVGAAPYSGSDHGPEKAFDGDPNTYYQFAYDDLGWVGIDLGAGNLAKAIKCRFKIASQVPVITNGAFQALPCTPKTLRVISSVTASDGRSATFNYALRDDDLLDTQWLELRGAEFGDSTTAEYTYEQTIGSMQPLVASARDPRGDKGKRIAYAYKPGAAYGFLDAERGFSSGAVVATLGSITGHKPTVTFPNGGVASAHFGSLNANILSRTDSLGRKTTFTHAADGAGFLASETDPRGLTTSYTRDTFGRRLTTTYADGTVETYTRDAKGQPLTKTLTGPGIAARTTTWTRDANSRPTRIDHPDGSHETFTYNAFGQPLTHRMRNGGTETMTYDATGLMLTQTDAEGNTTTYTYNAAGLVASVTNARGFTTSFTYDERGQLTQETYPDASSVAYEYDDFGNRTVRIDELNHLWTYTYDEFDRMLTSTDQLSRTTTYDYSLVPGSSCGSCNVTDKPTRITLASGKKIERTYDVEWQMLTETVGAGTADAATTAYTYDDGGNVLTITDPRGEVWTSTYDNRNRRLTAKDPLNDTTTWTYDAEGNALTVTRPDAGVTTSIYDARNRVTSSTDPKSQTTTFAYDDGDNLVTMTDPRGNTYAFEYDMLNRRTKFIYPGPGGTPNAADYESWTFDDTADAATPMTVYRNRAAQTMSCTFDNRGRETFCDYSDTATPDVTNTYDLAGRKLSCTTSVSSCAYAYDDANQLLSETQTPAALATAFTVAYTYDSDGNRASLTYPSGTVVEYTYTNRNQIAQITADGPPPLATYGYDLAGNRTAKALENGSSTAYVYDDKGQMTSLTHSNGGGAFASYAYTYDNVGNRRSMTTGGFGASSIIDAYDYDPVDQVAGVKYEATGVSYPTATGTREVAYAYDPAGNRSSLMDGAATTNYAANELNQYTAITGIPTVAHDGLGNLTTYGASGFTYDSKSRLLSANTGSHAMAVAYDCGNRPVSRTIDGVTTFFVYDGWSILEERNAAGALVASYVHGPVIDEILTRTTSSGTTYYQHDALGSTVALTDASGAPVERYRYDVYGAATVADASGTTISGTTQGNRFLFTGREWIAEVGIYDYRNRVYSSEVGRFLQTDPIRLSSLYSHLYTYVMNRVLVSSDPMGLYPANAPSPCADDCPHGKWVKVGQATWQSKSIWEDTIDETGRSVRTQYCLYSETQTWKCSDSELYKTTIQTIKKHGPCYAHG